MSRAPQPTRLRPQPAAGSEGQLPYSRKAIASLVCALVGAVFVVPVLAALPLGYAALQDIRRDGTRGRWAALAGVCVALTVAALWALYGLSHLFLDTP